MTKAKNTKRALLLSALSLLMCVSMLIGSTFAWFTDSVTSGGNKIVAGNLKIDLLLKDGDDNWTSIKENNKAIFDYENWEPGYTDVKVLKVVNEGTLALKWMAKFVSAYELTALADVIDVYVNTSVQDIPADRADISTWKNVGTVRDFVNTIKETTKGELKAEESAYLGIALKMRESAGNDYQGMSLGGVFDIQILATQLTYESDSFDDQYDADAPLNYAPVSNINELKIALANKEPNIVLTENIETAETLNVDYAAIIDGDGFVISRADGFTGTVFTVKANATLTMVDAVVDGGAVWSGAADSTLGRGVANNGITATGNLIKTEGNGNIVLNAGVVLQNNVGAHAVYLDHGSKKGSLTLNGAQIINNQSDSGAIWGGGAIIINEGSKINGNSSTGSAGAIRMVSACNLTMNGGEINNNRAVGDGGVIWGYGSSTYNFNGGEFAYNESAGTGGVIYTGTYSVINIGGDFEMHDNKAANSGAIRLTDHTSMNMVGGKIYNNTQNGESNAFNTWNNSISITGGEISDNISYVGGLGLTIGEAKIDGVIAYDLSTNHNTAYLAENFNAFKFTVDETNTNFVNFNFKPATGYTYTEGDEAKLICMNEGYSTYWDATTSTFRLQAN